jgi:hypothetical protein
MTKELRRHPRFEPRKPLHVYDTLSQVKMGLLANLSEEGMMIIGDKDVVDGAVYQIAVPLDSYEKDVLNVGVECLWSADAEVDKQYWSGYRIIDISDDNKLTLGLLIDALAQNQ